jgi:hypothetical protein
MNEQLRDALNVLKTRINDAGLLLVCLSMDATARTGSGTGETDAWTYTLPAATLVTNGMTLRISAWGKTASGGSTRTIKLHWNGASLLTATTTVASGEWYLDAMIMRTGASAQTARVAFGAVAAGLNTATPATLPKTGTVWDSGAPVNADLTGTVALKTTLQDSAAGTNVTQLGLTLELLTAA